ncbi:MAG TPA: hypothetical protein VL025_11735 [Thermoanaerobaculia bacterium]|nr:hypothetical protein [Thermoanaerobaculia bacterium]
MRHSFITGAKAKRVPSGERVQVELSLIAIGFSMPPAAVTV